MARLAYKSSIGVGVSTIVTIFMVLLMTTFSMLTLASAKFDYNLSRLTNQATGDYYAADCQACQWLAEVQSIVDEQPPGQWIDSIGSLNPDTRVDQQTDNQAIVVYTSFRIDSKRFLDVSISIDGTGRIQIIDWISKTRFDPTNTE